MPSFMIASVKHEIEPRTVEQDGAGAALTVIAAFLGTRQVETVTQGVEQGNPGRDGQFVRRAVDMKRDRDLGRPRKLFQRLASSSEDG